MKRWIQRSLGLPSCTSDATEIVAYLTRAAAGEGQRRVVTKAFYENLEGRAEIDEMALQLPDSVFVVLWRREQLAAFSCWPAKTGTWHHRKLDATERGELAQHDATVHVDINEFRTFRGKQVHNTASAIDALAGPGRCHVICYEDLAGDQVGAMNNFAREAFGQVTAPTTYENGSASHTDRWPKPSATGTNWPTRNASTRTR